LGGNLRIDGPSYWNDSVFGRTQGSGSPTGGFYGAGRMSYSVKTLPVTASATYIGTESLDDVNYDSRIDTSKI